jgi:sugar lactone lactonase YvrE
MKSKVHRMARGLVGSCLVVLLLVGNAGAVTLNPGDILIADEGSRKIIRIDPLTRDQTIVAQGGLLDSVFAPRGLTVDRNGDILISDLFFAGQSRILKVNPTTGTQTVLTFGTFLERSFGIAVDSNASIIVVALDNSLGPDGLIRIDPLSGAQAAFSLGGFFDNPTGITISGNGDILVANDNGSFPGHEIDRVIRVDPLTGAQTIVASSVFSDNPDGYPTGIAIATNGEIFVSDISFYGGIIRVDPATGNQTQIASRLAPGTLIDRPVSIVVDSNNDILIADFAAARVIKLDSTTGTQSIVAEGGNLISPYAIAIVPAPAVLEVDIDIQPGAFPNSINPTKKAVISVAILSTDTFDATTVDQTTVLFGKTGTEAAPLRFTVGNVDGDADTDLILRFYANATGIACGDTSAYLTGETYSGQMLQGVDSIRTVGCK